MANFDILSRSEMVDLINSQTMATKSNTDQILSLTERIVSLEECVRLTGNKRKSMSTNSVTTNPERKVQELKNRYIDLQLERASIIAFNTNNMSLPLSERLKWTKTVKLSGGNERVTSLTEVKDNASLLALIDSEHLDSLCNASGEYVSFNKNVIKKSWVFIKEEKLVPLCRDFKDGVGVELLWTPDEKMLPPSDNWIRQAKMEKDPRKKYIDPSTMKLWTIDESFDEDGVESIVNELIESVVEKVSDEFLGQCA